MIADDLRDLAAYLRRRADETEDTLSPVGCLQVALRLLELATRAEVLEDTPIPRRFRIVSNDDNGPRAA